MNDPWPAQHASYRVPAVGTLQRVSTTIAIAHGLAATGRNVDLQGLESAAGLLCAQVLDLPPNEGAAMSIGLCDLRSRLTDLSRILAAQAK